MCLEETTKNVTKRGFMFTLKEVLESGSQFGHQTSK